MQLAVQFNLNVHQMDVKTAFLNAPIDCELYVEQPKGFEQTGAKGEKLVCKLNRSLYGLKQSGRNWNNLLHSHLVEQGFQQSAADHCVYNRQSGKELTIVIIWVDDIIIASTNDPILMSVKKSLSQRFKMKDLGLSFHGRVRSNRAWHFLRAKPNTWHWQLQHRKLNS